MFIQILIIRNKGNRSLWFFGNSLKYYLDVSEVVSLRELFFNDLERVFITMVLNLRCYRICRDGVVFAFRVIQLYFIFN